MQEFRLRKFAEAEMVSLLEEYQPEFTLYFVPLPASTSEDDIEYCRMWNSLPLYGCDRFMAKGHEVLFQTLFRLNKLSREHPIWQRLTHWGLNSNLYVYCRWVLESSPNDVLAVWAQAYLDVLRCDNNFGLKYWAKLLARGDFDISLVVQAALVATLSTDKVEQNLADFLKQTKTEKAAAPLLEKVAGSKSRLIADFGKEVQGLLVV